MYSLRCNTLPQICVRSDFCVFMFCLQTNKKLAYIDGFMCDPIPIMHDNTYCNSEVLLSNHTVICITNFT